MFFSLPSNIIFLLVMAKYGRIFTSIKVMSMKVIEKPFLVGGDQVGTFLAYTEIESELLLTPETEPYTRVLPAPFFYEKRLYFAMVRRYEPGEKVSFPNGGFEVRDEGGAMRSYDLDQVILHPQIIKHKKTLDKMARRAEKESKKRDRQWKKAARDANVKPKNKTGKRGRPALSPEMKAAREAEVVARATRSGGKRGRPKSEVSTPKTLKIPTGGKRGRPALSPEAIAAQVQAKAVVRARSGGKRGRPKRK
jgi:hypothetical protein